MSNLIVHTLWVSGKLSLLEQLTIKLLQKHGHEVHLWSYDTIDNVPPGTVRRDGREILPEASIFTFKGIPLLAIPRGGIGSLSHWSDQFQLKLLNQEGGIYIQLDVACLRPLELSEYAFVAHGQDSLAAFLMKSPKGSEFTMKAWEHLSSTINASTITDMDWDRSMSEMGTVLRSTIPGYSQYTIPNQHILDLGCRRSGPFFDSIPISNDVYILHWSNATVNELKNDPIVDSYYYKLLQSVDLI